MKKTKDKEYYEPQGYLATLDLLNPMWKVSKGKPRQSQIIRKQEFHSDQKYLWMLPETDFITPQGNVYIHESRCADIYVSLSLTGLLSYWKPYQLSDEFEKLDLKYDRNFIFDNKVYFLEEDTGSEGLPDIEVKAEKYVELFKEHKGERLHVIFPVNDYDQDPITGKWRKPRKQRANNLLEVLKPYTIKNQFLVCYQENLVKKPLERILVSPKKPELFINFSEV